MDITFTRANRDRNRLKMYIDGPAGHGKTYSALRIAYGLSDKVFLIDTQNGASSLYAGEQIDGRTWHFEQCVLTNFGVDMYLAAIHAAESAGAEVIIIDSLSHVWNSTGGILEVVDRKAMQRTKDGATMGTFSAWKSGDEQYRQLVNGILQSPCHIIATIRMKNKHRAERDKNGKLQIVKVGWKDVQRQGIEYEFDIGLTMDSTHTGTVTQSHSALFPMSSQIPLPGDDMAQKLKQWLCAPTTQPVPVPKQLGQVPAKTVSVADTTEPLGTIAPQQWEVGKYTNAEIAAKKERIKKAIGTLITKQQFDRWKVTQQIPMGEALSPMHAVSLCEDLDNLERTGSWNPLPF